MTQPVGTGPLPNLTCQRKFPAPEVKLTRYDGYWGENQKLKM